MNRMITLKLMVRTGATPGLHKIAIPDKIRSAGELYFAVYGFDSQKAKAYIAGNEVAVNVPDNVVPTWMSITYPMRL